MKATGVFAALIVLLLAGTILVLYILRLFNLALVFGAFTPHHSSFFFLVIVLSCLGHVNCQTFDFTVLHHTTTSVTATSVLQVAATYSGVTGDVCADGIHDGLAHAACGLYSVQYSLQYYGYSKSAHAHNVGNLYHALSHYTQHHLYHIMVL